MGEAALHTLSDSEAARKEVEGGFLEGIQGIHQLSFFGVDGIFRKDIIDFIGILGNRIAG